MADLSRCYLHTLGDSEKQKLDDLRSRVPKLIAKARAGSEEAKALPKFLLWGIDIEAASEATDIILLKFLRAEELDVEKAAERLVKTLIFRADCRIDVLTKSELPDYFQGHDAITGFDVDGRPVMFSRFGKMDLPRVFGDTEAFVRYRAKWMEEAISKLKFQKGAPEDLCQVHDYSGVPLVFKTAEVKGGVTAVTQVFGMHYPEFKGKTILVNFPSAFSKLWKAFCIFIPERTQKKFQILGEGDQANLFLHIPPESVPEGLGGMQREQRGDLDDTACKVVPVRARGAEEVLLAEATEPRKMLFELRVCTLDIAYEVVFVPFAGGAEEVVQRSEKGALLQAADGVVSGEYNAKVGGALHCRFKNEGAWFKSRLCACRGKVL